MFGSLIVQVPLGECNLRSYPAAKKNDEIDWNRFQPGSEPVP